LIVGEIVDLFIITGTTRGLGNTLAKKALEKGHTVVSLARKNTLDHSNHFFVPIDLTEIDSIELAWNSFFKEMNLDEYKNIHLILNAAQLKPVGKIENLPTTEMIEHIAVNFTAPVVLTKLFINTFIDQTKYRIITNVSSGAASHPIAGWSLYCSTKSALSMLTNVFDRDHNPSDSQLKMINFNPGVMDTSMQEYIRGLDKENFPRVSEFISLKDNNELKSTDKVASFLLEKLNEPEKILSTTISV
jgi:benzil reductase ((S)-benzoin forming)